MANVLKIKDENGKWQSLPYAKGENGLTPYIGANGNWWIGEADTGVSAVPKVVTLTQTEYNSMVSAGTIDANTYYFIKEG